MTFFCQDFLPHLGHFILLVLPMWGAKFTALKVGTYRWPHSPHGEEKAHEGGKKSRKDDDDPHPFLGNRRQSTDEDGEKQNKERKDADRPFQSQKLAVLFLLLLHHFQ